MLSVWINIFKKLPNLNYIVIKKLGIVKDYLPVDAPLLDYLVTETEGPTGWKYPKLQDLKKFQERRGLNYSVIEEVEVQESLEGVELHPDADEKAQTQEKLLSALKF